MTINVLTLGQRVSPQFGQYRGRRGTVKRVYFMADSHGAGTYYRVKLDGVSGARHYTADRLAVQKESR